MLPVLQDKDVPRKSKQFALLVKKARKKLGYSIRKLGDLTGISQKRLRSLEEGKRVFRASELQLIGVIVGAGLDKVFQLPNYSNQKIHGFFQELRKQEIGLLAATGAPRIPKMGIPQPAFERSGVHLHYIAACLEKFRE